MISSTNCVRDSIHLPPVHHESVRTPTWPGHEPQHIAWSVSYTTLGRDIPKSVYETDQDRASEPSRALLRNPKVFFENVRGSRKAWSSGTRERVTSNWKWLPPNLSIYK